jgi:hypothetical protein
MDEVDRRLLDALRANARATYAELGRSVGLSGVPDVAALETAIRQLNAIRGVARTRTTVVLSTKFEDRVPAAPAG